MKKTMFDSDDSYLDALIEDAYFDDDIVTNIDDYDDLSHGIPLESSYDF